MISNLVDLFIYLFNSCLAFDYIMYLLFACCLVASLATIFVYILRGKY